MRLLVVGGRLQGTEAVYLARKAGYETLLVDRRPACPAAGLADRFVVADITADEATARSLVGSCDAILPACEDWSTLEWLAARASSWGAPLLFDLDAYRVTRSKRLSRELFDTLGVSRPASGPACGYPVIVKPDAASGSLGVTRACDDAELAQALRRLELAGHRPLVEEWVDGPSLSLEVLSWNGSVRTMQVTGLEFDAAHDCKRVVAPVGEAASAPAGQLSGRTDDWGRRHGLRVDVRDRFAALGRLLAKGLGLNGVMDVEVMVRDGSELVVLEVDARLPSQTPTAVFWSSGRNIVQALVEAGLCGTLSSVAPAAERGCVYQHIRAHDGRLELAGEHVISGARELRLVPGFYGAAEALTDRDATGRSWVATLITAGTTLRQAEERARAVVATIARSEGLDLVDELPAARTRTSAGRACAMAGRSGAGESGMAR